MELKGQTDQQAHTYRYSYICKATVRWTKNLTYDKHVVDMALHVKFAENWQEHIYGCTVECALSTSSP